MAILLHELAEPDLRAELHAAAYFRWYTYWLDAGDPICGWLVGYDKGWRVTLADFRRLVDVGPDDVFYVNSVQPPLFMALIEWLKGMAPECRPKVVAEFGTNAGVTISDSGQILVPQTTYDPRPTLYRWAATNLEPGLQGSLRLATFDPASSLVYQALLGYPVSTLPQPHKAVTTCRSRVGRRPVTVAIIGHQRPEKGYHLVPATVRQLLGRCSDVRVLVHNGDPDGMPESQQAMRDLAAADRRIILDERVADGTLWAQLLDQSDLILCPYSQARFADSYSAVASEAIANAIPMVVPDRTSLSALLAEFGQPGTVFAEQTPESIAEATLRALDGFDDLARKADAAARAWSHSRGAGHLARAILEFARG